MNVDASMVEWGTRRGSRHQPGLLYRPGLFLRASRHPFRSHHKPADNCFCLEALFPFYEGIEGACLDVCSLICKASACRVCLFLCCSCPQWTNSHRSGIGDLGFPAVCFHCVHFLCADPGRDPVCCRVWDAILCPKDADRRGNDKR